MRQSCLSMHQSCLGASSPARVQRRLLLTLCVACSAGDRYEVSFGLPLDHHRHASSARWTSGGSAWTCGQLRCPHPHTSHPPCPQGSRLRPDALRLPHVFKNFPFGVEQGVAAERGQRKRCPPPLRPPTPCLIDPMGGPCAEGHTGGEAQGVWGQQPPAEERPRRGRDAGGSSRP